MRAPSIGVLEHSILLEALQSVSQGVLVTGIDRRIVYCNAAFSAICGFAADEVVGRPCTFVQGAQTNPRTVAAIALALANEQSFSGEILNYRKNGDAFWNDLTITPVRDELGRLTNFIGVIRDITPLKDAEFSLIASVERQCFLLDRVQAGIVVHSSATEILYANAAATILLGVPNEPIIGVVYTDPRWAFVREDGSQMPIAEYPVNRAVATRSVVNNLVIGSRSAGDEPVWLMCNAYPVLDDAGIPAEVVVSYSDVTELKIAERALQKSDERLRLVLQGSNDAPWDWDLANNDLYYSARWWQMIGLDVDELPATSDLWLQLAHPDDRLRMHEELTRALAAGLTVFEIEFRLGHKSGHYVPILLRGFVLRDQNGTPIRVSGTNTDITERKATEERINQLAFYDALTSLPNRRLLMEQLHKALLASARSGRQGALLFIDRDNFKVLNDTLGHDRGDELLEQVALRLRECVREADTVARLGGDEFVVMLEHLQPSAHDAAIEAEHIGKKILAALDLPYVLAEREHRTSASIGIALFNDGRQGVDGLLRQADLAMYQAKAMGRNTLRNFDTSMQIAVDERLTIENDLHKALQRDEMVLYYQPQVNEFANIIGAEVLVRWRHPLSGLIFPAAFVPLAESTGLILPLGNWVLRSACAQLAAWACDAALSDLSLSVNVSVRQFREADFANQVLDIVARSGADPTRLKLEMTESLLADNIEDIIEKMSLLKASGICFSLDDFGTGYSSLKYLQRLPLDELKIDRTFVCELPTNGNDATIACAIISLAEKLGLAVIAEGVESDVQRQFLLDNGCRAYQGYFFGKPVPLAGFEAAIRGEVSDVARHS